MEPSEASEAGVHNDDLKVESELETFRQRWREEVTARSRLNDRQETHSPNTSLAGPSASGPGRPVGKTSQPPSASLKQAHVQSYGDSEYQARTYHDLEDKEEPLKLVSEKPRTKYSKEHPQTALEHYEKAAERETEGNLGDSVSLYRRAFKLDASVHEKYKNKHFPPSALASKPANPNPSNAPVTVPETGHHSLHGGQSSMAELMEEFASCSIEPAAPETSLSKQRPCHLARIPQELLVEVLMATALKDVSAFARLAQVCKRFAYLVTSEEQIWKRVTLGSEVGFAAMHYVYACDLRGQQFPLAPRLVEAPSSALAAENDLVRDLTPVPYPTYRTQFRNRPRIRFNGCYISTVNYTRAGVGAQSTLSWNNPVHIVTYYRYLRFFRDGTVLSLLTTAEPADVVHHLTKENAHSNHTGMLPAAIMKDALPGRWRLSGPLSDGQAAELDNASEEEEPKGPGEYIREPLDRGEDGSVLAQTALQESEGDVLVETEGVVPKYMWKMHFGLGSAGRKDGGTRNNKLTWKGFWSYNRLTDDWGKFELKNDRAFYWSRVRSYGTR